MALFQGSQSTDRSGETIVGAGVKVEGEIHAQGDVVVEGEVHGVLETNGHVTVAPGALVEATVTAGSIALSGKIIGTTTVREKLEITSSGVMEGDVTTAVLMVAEGGTVQGKVAMRVESSKSAMPKEKNLIA